MYLAAVSRRKVILYICFFDEAHGSSSRSVACLEDARLEQRPECRRREGENSVSSKHTLTMACVPECPRDSASGVSTALYTTEPSRRFASGCSGSRSRKLENVFGIWDEWPLGIVIG